MGKNNKPYLIVIYGKDGCSRCLKLKRQVSEMLADENISRDFDMDYQNLSTVSGMAAYAMSETVNGQRIPALQIMKYNKEKKTYEKLADPRKETPDKDGQLFVPVYLQAQTNYGRENEEISGNEITELLKLARGL